MATHFEPSKALNVREVIWYEENLRWRLSKDSSKEIFQCEFLHNDVRWKYSNVATQKLAKPTAFILLAELATVRLAVGI